MSEINAASADEATIRSSASGGSGKSLPQALLWMCAHYEKPMTEKALFSGLPSSSSVSPDIAMRAMEQAGFTVGIVNKPPSEIFSYLFPTVLLLKDDAACVLLDRVIDPATKACRYKVILPEAGTAETMLAEEELRERYSGNCLLIKPHHKTDMRAGEPTPNVAGGWLWGTFWTYRKYYLGVVIAASLINVLALASSFFTMNVYDRVVPTQAYATLWSLAIGVVMAMLFELCARFLRGYLIDIAGKKADLVVGTMLFRQAMAIRLEFRPASAGSFSHQLREFESVRDFATSATLATITDLPFVFLYIAVVYTLAGPLAWVPLGAIPIVLAVSYFIQYPMAKTMREHLRESSLKQGVVIEAVEGIESLKAAGAEGFMQKRWEDCSALTAHTSMKSRLLSSLAVNVVTTLQQLETVFIVVWGVYLIHAGQLTMGGLIGAVILASRAVAPLGQVVGLAVRFQQAKAAMETLNRLMKMPTERSSERTYLTRPTLQGNLQLEGLSFAYPAAGQLKLKPTLTDISLSITAGERVAILGRIGSGKSTLLRVMAGLYQAQKGSLQVDGIDVRQIDPTDWRSAVGYVGQEVRLFYGTLRDNIVMGCPDASTDEFLAVTRMTGLDRLAASHPMGYDMQIGEMGRGLSGGQQQLVALARCMLSGPSILMMDEPTSAMDLQTEAMFMNQLEASINGRTFVLVTHRFSLLKLVNRVIVVDGGRIVANGPRDEVMTALQANAKQPVATSPA